MGQKVNPYGFRLGYIKTWHSNWYVKNNYAVILQQDLAIRNYIETELAQAAIAKTEITRTADQVKVTVYSAKPGVAIGKKGTGIEKIRNDLKKITNCPLFFNIAEVKRPDSEAKLIAENIAQQLEKRVAFRRAMKKVMTSAFRSGVKGIKIKCSGRLGGAEIARTEGYAEKKVPLHTLRADIDYNTAQAKTTFGIGSTAQFDGTLTDKALSAAIVDVLEEMSNTIQARQWRTDILAVEDGQVYVSGGPSQGLVPGDRLIVMKAGKTVTSSQTGIGIELPSTEVAELEVVSSFGSGDLGEGSISRVISGSVKELSSNIYVVSK